VTAPQLDLLISTTPPSRGTNAETEAFARKFVDHQREIVLAYIQSQGRWGATMREAEHALLITRQSLCFRFWELCGGRWINGIPQYGVLVQRTPERRERCNVYVAI
jgi:hypothetical protein